MPTCAEARPGSCPSCGAAALPVGGRFVVVGHGLAERQSRGPREPGGVPQQLVVLLRRYRCRACRAVIVVGPRGLVRRRCYSAGAIAFALSMYARGETSRTVRAATCPAYALGHSAVERWATLVRWIEAARCGELFDVRGIGAPDRRAVAESVMLALAARAGHVFGADLSASAFAGAAIAA
jgi:hypothetical protein